MLGSSSNESKILFSYQPECISTYPLVLKIFKESILGYNYITMGYKTQNLGYNHGFQKHLSIKKILILNFSNK
jgi:hypothetical protein